MLHFKQGRTSHGRHIIFPFSFLIMAIFIGSLRYAQLRVIQLSPVPFKWYPSRGGESSQLEFGKASRVKPPNLFIKYRAVRATCTGTCGYREHDRRSTILYRVLITEWWIVGIEGYRGSSMWRKKKELCRLNWSIYLNHYFKRPWKVEDSYFHGKTWGPAAADLDDGHVPYTPL